MPHEGQKRLLYVNGTHFTWGHEEELRQKVLTVSPATFDRLLKRERIRVGVGHSTTTPGTTLKHQIKVRTFSDWNENKPGFFEIDLVAHCGTTVSGVFINTLVMTDIVTTWTECIGLIRKSADDVILGLMTASKLLPFNVLGLDADNGCEFINYDLMNYCEQNKITFTRSRAYKKNDQAHVEQKNGSIVRRLVGYDRYETEAAWEALCELYSVLRLYINFFQPTLKLKQKIRIGSKTIKKYEKAQTPYERVLSSEYVNQTIKDQLTQQYQTLDPLLLKEKIHQLQTSLWQHAAIGEVIPLIDELSQNPDQEKTIKNDRSIFYRKVKKVRGKKRAYRTRPDPFVDVYDSIKFELEINPNINVKTILEKLMKRYPNHFYKGHLRSLQRRVNEIRAEQTHLIEKYQQLMVDKKFMTNNEIGVRVNG